MINTNHQTKIEMRWLQGDELKAIEPAYRAQGWVPLNPALSRALVVFENDVPVGIAAFTCRPMIDLWLSVQHRGMGLAEQMTGELVKFLYDVNAPECYVVARNPFTERLAQLHGMQRLNDPVYYKKGR